MYKVHLFQKNPNLIPFSTLILGTKVPQSLFSYHHMKKSSGVRTALLGGQTIDPSIPIH
jgi:hypothetical protein